jgi:hypothetical protein
MDKQAFLTRNWQAAQLRVALCRASLYRTVPRLNKAVAAGNRADWAAAERDRLVALAALQRAEVAEAEARLLAGEDSVRDGLRHQVGSAAKIGRILRGGE